MEDLTKKEAGLLLDLINVGINDIVKDMIDKENTEEDRAYYSKRFEMALEAKEKFKGRYIND